MAVLLWKRPRTPAVRDEAGREVPGAVASLERIELGGSPQWVLVRERVRDREATPGHCALEEGVEEAGP